MDIGILIGGGLILIIGLIFRIVEKITGNKLHDMEAPERKDTSLDNAPYNSNNGFELK